MTLIADLSNNNATPDFARLARDAAGVYLKASEGHSFVDPTYTARRRAARREGLHVGAYHFAQPALNTPQAEARHFLSCIGGIVLDGDLMPVLDLERSGHLGAASAVEWARTFNRLIHDRTGVWPLFYANTSFVRALAPATPIGGGLWLADYGPNDGRRHAVTVPHPWKKIRLHQFTSKGRLAGVRGDVDVSHTDKPPVVRRPR